MTTTKNLSQVRPGDCINGIFIPVRSVEQRDDIWVVRFQSPEMGARIFSIGDTVEVRS
jgi:hypothetical protein